jgi:uncharacterized membrane protein
MIVRPSQMICPNCASEMPDVSVFCPSCGRSVSAGSEVVAEGPREAAMGALAYFTAVPAILFLVIPATKNRRFVRFHAWQSVFFAGLTVILALALRLLFVILSILPVLGFLVAWLSAGLGFLAIIVLWAVLVTKASQGQGFELPWIGPWAAHLAN